MNSRQIAFNILKKVFINKSYSNILLNSLSNQTNISKQDKDLVFNIVHGVISNQIYLKHITDKLIDSKKTNKEIQILLWLSIYQFIFLDAIPNYAIVNESVEIAKKINRKTSGFVNAVLNKFSKNTTEFSSVGLKNKELELCIKNSFPYSLYLMLKQQYNKDVLDQIVVDNIKIPRIYFRVNTLKVSTDEFFDKYKDEFNLEKTDVKDCLIANKSIVNTEMYKNGLITIQDKASILVANILNPSLNSNVLDMCSAPGGKLTHISSILQNTGSVIGNEISENKLSLIKDNIKRLDCKNIELINMDGRDINKQEFFDYILLDAPCSGFGVFKRKPEIKLNLDFNQLKATVKLQEQLLENAYKNLKVNGEMVYSTCTINKQENDNQITKFLNKHKDMIKVFEQQIFGFESNTDGFYICKMKKLSFKG
ncbi:rRNA methyltransferase small subunit B (Sun family protein) [Mycoplasma yeatsii 13926]|uniref:16S rRNA (cytosine(967)-C(5))-methyltransferase n=1 Tax=Mycoplasma yeatsii 13926 TaxID=1188240 RepID=S6G6T0_9MOLU|nr:16S rRNA (cytosine(967)-C(5))-methyltransferase RsmB [Mycoplasma yeatsii]EOA07058.1 rRNA methyltransferase small subunit B (Sun family protein) [Mycoplasma yeatsii 13926]